jgi:hypothetical protein
VKPNIVIKKQTCDCGLYNLENMNTIDEVNANNKAIKLKYYADNKIGYGLFSNVSFFKFYFNIIL